MTHILHQQIALSLCLRQAYANANANVYSKALVFSDPLVHVRLNSCRFRSGVTVATAPNAASYFATAKYHY